MLSLSERELTTTSSLAWYFEHFYHFWLQLYIYYALILTISPQRILKLLSIIRAYMPREE